MVFLSPTYEESTTNSSWFDLSRFLEHYPQIQVYAPFKAVIFLTIIHHITCADDILQLNDATTNMNDSNT